MARIRPATKLTKEDIIRIVKEQEIKFITLQFTDIFGIMKNVAITASQLERALDNQIMFDGSSIEGFVRIEESDQNLRPDLDSFEIIPWKSSPNGTARMICDIYTPEGKPFEGDPRYMLKKVLKEAKDMGYEFNVGPECEFFLFQTDAQGKPTTITHDDAGYFDLGPIDLGESARRDMVLALEDMGYEIEASHHEVAHGQHEIDFKYTDALKSADNIITFKMVVKTLAKEHGLHATFMPKPIYGISGSGMHVNMSMFKDGANAFADAKDKLGLSKCAYSFIAGILKHVPALTAITNPTVNSYKRLVPGYEAPVYIAWSAQNRSPLVRIPYARGNGTRLELRSPDPSCNPYLALAVCLAAGLDGIRNNLTPPPSVDENIFHMSDDNREQAGITNLPNDIISAIQEFKKSTLMRETLGEHIFTRFIEAKEIEWQDYRTRISQWELDKYLTNY